MSDCRLTTYEIRDGHFEVTIEEWPYTVPDEVVMRLKRNPTGRAVVCYTYKAFDPPARSKAERTAPQDKIEILCFVPEAPVS